MGGQPAQTAHSRAGRLTSCEAAEVIGRPKPVEIIEDPDFVGAFLIKKAKKC
jgi:hypothetical protein